MKNCLHLRRGNHKEREKKEGRTKREIKGKKPVKDHSVARSWEALEYLKKVYSEEYHIKDPSALQSKIPNTVIMLSKVNDNDVENNQIYLL